MELMMSEMDIISRRQRTARYYETQHLGHEKNKQHYY